MAVNQDAPAAEPLAMSYSLVHQKIDLDIQLVPRTIKGRVEITVHPSSPDSRRIKLHCRQAKISSVKINSKNYGPQTWKYADPYERTKLPYEANVHHAHRLKDRLSDQLNRHPVEPELEINIPKYIKIAELDPTVALDGSGRPTTDPAAVDLTQTNKVAADGPKFTPVLLTVEYTITDVRDGLQFCGWDRDDLRYPHAYTQGFAEGTPSALFPCVDTLESKSTFEISIRTARTVGDALYERAADADGDLAMADADAPKANKVSNPSFTEKDKALDLVVICSGDITDEIVDPADSTKKTSSFVCTNPVSCRHIGFAIGPFEEVNLAAFRESDEDDKLGRNAVHVHGFSLPGRASEVRNTCLPLAKAMDYFVITYGSYPFSSYKLCFVDEMPTSRFDAAALTICSNRLLFPEDIVDPMDSVTRELINGLSNQWAGVHITPRGPEDLWAVVGISYYITDMFLRKLAGNNEYRFQQKKAADRVCQLDIGRPSIYESGRYTWVDPAHLELIEAKAPLVLFILDRRLTKVSGSTGLSRIVSRIFLNAKVGELENSALSTAHFIKTCEKLGHAKLDVFFNQWVHGCGCPRFRITQRFNKKRLVVEMQISQSHNEINLEQQIGSSNFMREVSEDREKVHASPPQAVFMGPMTIRIHEADGTPYEHIVEIKDATTRFDIPYNTKYKRLKRSRRQRERLAAGAGADALIDGQEDVLLYCLGDVLQSEEEVRDWNLSEWSREDEEKMSSESYEWIRMDADFEWICQMSINMPGYMFVSQLQQDRDVVAQYETIQFLDLQKPHPLVSTILIRTLMDSRYFYGIRTAAAEALVNHAKEDIGWLGFRHLEKAFQDLFCLGTSLMPRSNDFSDRASYFVQCAILQAISKVRSGNGKAPIFVRKFLYEKLRYNDNTNNEFSDCFYIATLMEGLAKAIASAPLSTAFDIGLDDTEDNHQFFKSCINEIDRYQRMDEWIPSYHNVVSMAALNCKCILEKSDSIHREPLEFFHYTQEGTYEELRVAAFTCLFNLGYGHNGHVLRWILRVLGYDASPFIRANLLRLFGQFLGAIATGEEGSVSNGVQQSKINGIMANGANNSGDNDDAMQQDGEGENENGGLIIVQDSATTQARQTELARKHTVPGAVAALKSALNRLQSLSALKDALWDAACSPRITMHELGELLTTCEMLFDAETTMNITLKYPQYWTVTDLDPAPTTDTEKGTRPTTKRLQFRRNGRYRTKRLEPRQAVAAANASPAATNGQAVNGASIIPPAPPSRTIKPIKLKVGGVVGGDKAKKTTAGGGGVEKPQSHSHSHPHVSVKTAAQKRASPSVEPEKPKLKLVFKNPKPSI